LSTGVARKKVMVLAGGPDREREVSLKSGVNVAEALKRANYDVLLRDILPDDLSALTEFDTWGGDALFPILHGPWGEGGHLQHILDERGDCYVGCASPAAGLCMDKHRTKMVLEHYDLPTPASEILCVGQPVTLELPVVIKPIADGSSFDLYICKTPQEVQHALGRIHQRQSKVLVEQFIDGHELTVGIIGTPGYGRDGYHALPVIHIVPATEFYDYDAKYDRDDTEYRIGVEQIDVPVDVLEKVQWYALQAFRELGCRHMGRVDVMLDSNHQPWILEINTLPGFTSHSLLPMAAHHKGLTMPELCDRLVRMAMGM
jgi:D-alanine-D-alanine ligase